MKKFCMLIAAALLFAMIMPLSAMAAPDTTKSVINVGNADAQDLLDGKFGNINGKTINFTEDITNVLDLARPTNHSGSNTTVDNNNYYRTLKNVTFTADPGVKVKGFSFHSGHVHNDGYDYVRNVPVGGGVTYYRHSSLQNIAFKGLTITGDIDFMLYQEGTSVKGIEIDGCTFTGKTKSANVAAIHLLSDSMYFENVTVKNCAISNYFQGIYVAGIDKLEVANNTIKNTDHNAVALQSSVSNPIKGKVTVEENFISGAKDRAIRINESADSANIAINNNIMVNSGDSKGEMIKAGAVGGAKINLENNYWDGKDVSKAVIGLNPPKTTGIVAGKFTEKVLQKYCADGFTGIQNADGTFTAMDINKLNSMVSAGLPQTGDSSQMMMWVMLLAISGACFVGLKKKANG